MAGGLQRLAALDEPVAAGNVALPTLSEHVDKAWNRALLCGEAIFELGYEIERRLAAIVAADVVGYSRLMGVDEVATLSALRSRRAVIIDPAIAEFGGRIVKTTGDGLLIELPSVVAAVECAVGIQAAMWKAATAIIWS